MSVCMSVCLCIYQYFQKHAIYRFLFFKPSPVMQREVTGHELVRVGQEPVLVELPVEVAALAKMAGAPRGVQGAPLSLHQHQVPGVVGLGAGRVHVFGVVAVALGDAVDQHAGHAGQSVQPFS